MRKPTAEEIAEELKKCNIEPPPVAEVDAKELIDKEKGLAGVLLDMMRPRRPMSTLDQDGCAARYLMLMTTPTHDAAGNPILVFPDREEWIGLHVAERDDRLKRRKAG